VLEEDGYHVLIQAWDFVPGTNWISGMQAGTRDAVRTIAVLSEAYLRSAYSSAEWQPALADDPDGSDRKLLVVRVAACRRPGLLAGVVTVDLFGISEADARASLRYMVTAAAMGRAKPATAPPFPGEGRVLRREPGFPGGLPQVLPSPYLGTSYAGTKSIEQTASAGRSGTTKRRGLSLSGSAGRTGSVDRTARSVRSGTTYRRARSIRSGSTGRTARPVRSGSTGKSSAKRSPTVRQSSSTLRIGSNSSRRGKDAGIGWVLCRTCWFFGTAAAFSIPVFIPNGPLPSTTILITSLGICVASFVTGGLYMMFRTDK
jgi:TIR domain